MSGHDHNKRPKNVTHRNAMSIPTLVVQDPPQKKNLYEMKCFVYYSVTLPNRRPATTRLWQTFIHIHTSYIQFVSTPRWLNFYLWNSSPREGGELTTHRSYHVTVIQVCKPSMLTITPLFWWEVLVKATHVTLQKGVTKHPQTACL